MMILWKNQVGTEQDYYLLVLFKKIIITIIFYLKLLLFFTQGINDPSGR